MNITEMTMQFRVKDYEEGVRWYEKLFRRPADFVPHEDFAEWEMLSGCWLQVAKGEPAEGSGPLRLGVDEIEGERKRLIAELGVEPSPVYSREGVPVKWCTFSDPWGNRIGFFQELSSGTNQKEQEK
ncbi:MAG TPA: VOC family protein [Bacillales bacterium]|nr:VOC family protein [Bacillales bacterium]